MISAEMLSKLGIRLNREAPESEFNIAERLSFLNDGQLYVAGKLPIYMVRQIETVSSAIAVDANGGISLAALDRLTVVEEDPASTTVFKGTADQGLSSVNDAYNGAVVINVTNGTYHVVTDYVGADLQFTVSEEVAVAPRTWNSGDEFIFPNGELALPGILNGDRSILDVLHSSGYYCTEIDDDDEWRHVIEKGYSYPSSNPRYRLQGTKLYLNPYTYGTTTGVIRYRATPTKITSSISCAFGEDVQELIVDYALYVGLKTARIYDMAGAVLQLVDKQIAQATNRYSKVGRKVGFEASRMTGRGGGRIGDILTRGG